MRSNFFLKSKIDAVSCISGLKRLKSRAAWYVSFCFAQFVLGADRCRFLLWRVLWWWMSLFCLKLKLKSMILWRHLKMKTHRWRCRLWSKCFHSNSSRASVAEEYFGLSRISFAALFCCTWRSFINFIKSFIKSFIKLMRWTEWMWICFVVTPVGYKVRRFFGLFLYLFHKPKYLFKDKRAVKAAKSNCLSLCHVKIRLRKICS